MLTSRRIRSLKAESLYQSICAPLELHAAQRIDAIDRIHHRILIFKRPLEEDSPNHASCIEIRKTVIHGQRALSLPAGPTEISEERFDDKDDPFGE